MGSALAVALAMTALLGCEDKSTPRVATVQPEHSHSSGAGPEATSESSGELSVEEYLAKQQEFVDCARANGAPDMPDPDEFGGHKLMAVPEGQVGLRLMRECSPIIEGIHPPEELMQRVREQQVSRMTEEQKRAERDFARCMQQNGLPDWPDPGPDGLPEYPEWAKPGSSQPRPPQVDQANEICQSILGGGPEPGQPDVRGDE